MRDVSPETPPGRSPHGSTESSDTNVKRELDLRRLTLIEERRHSRTGLQARVGVVEGRSSSVRVDPVLFLPRHGTQSKPTLSFREGSRIRRRLGKVNRQTGRTPDSLSSPRG